ncbi:MAG: hypothetical protein SGJ09_11590 [Phycisphaerae bacterium]|nr:hypothetical protein [Phycisphaerae bacterium]
MTILNRSFGVRQTILDQPGDLLVCRADAFVEEGQRLCESALKAVGRGADAHLALLRDGGELTLKLVLNLELNVSLNLGGKLLEHLGVQLRWRLPGDLFAALNLNVERLQHPNAEAQTLLKFGRRLSCG